MHSASPFRVPSLHAGVGPTSGCTCRATSQPHFVLPGSRPRDAQRLLRISYRLVASQQPPAGVDQSGTTGRAIRPPQSRRSTAKGPHNEAQGWYGTSVASRWRNSSGDTICIAPSRQGRFSLSTTSPAALHCTCSFPSVGRVDVAARLLQRLAVRRHAAPRCACPFTRRVVWLARRCASRPRSCLRLRPEAGRVGVRDRQPAACRRCSKASSCPCRGSW